MRIAATVSRVPLLLLPWLGACAAAPPEPCSPTSISVPLLGQAGDSPIVPVRVQGRDAAMFFSPAFGPLLFRDNGPIVFPRYHRVALRQQDGDESTADASFASGLSIGALPVATRKGDALSEPEDRQVDGRPIVGMLGRSVLPDDAIVALDSPARRLTVSTVCPGTAPMSLPGSIDMQQIVLLVPVQIDGHGLQAILDPDLPVSILPKRIAEEIGIDDATLASEPSVVTRFGRGVLGRRHRVGTLVLGDNRLRDVAFDVEAGVAYPILGLNVLSLGLSVFDFRDGRFAFRQTTAATPAPTALHFDRTRVVHVSVSE